MLLNAATSYTHLWVALKTLEPSPALCLIYYSQIETLKAPCILVNLSMVRITKNMLQILYAGVPLYQERKVYRSLVYKISVFVCQV